MPGLWDMHVHLMINGHSDYDYWDKTYLQLFKMLSCLLQLINFLMAGVTSARDLGGPLEESIMLEIKLIQVKFLDQPCMLVAHLFKKNHIQELKQFRWGSKWRKGCKK